MIVPRPGLRDVAPYESSQFDVEARLNTNECPYPLPDGFGDDLAKAVRDLSLNRYPDREAEALRAGLADVADHPFEGTWAANGSNEILLQLLQAYGGPGRRVVVFEPTYALHSRLAWVTRSDVVAVRLEPPWRIDARHVAEAWRADPSVVFVCSPNNPTGNVPPAETIHELVARGTTLVVVDEAYIEFGGDSVAPLVRRHPNLVVVRTFSKAFALAGARVGYCLASPDLVDDLRRVRLPYHLSSLNQAAGLVPSPTGRTRSASWTPSETSATGSSRRYRRWARRPTRRRRTVVLFRPPRHAREVWRGLLDRGVLVRDLTELVPECLRVTAGTPEEVDLFLSALEEVLT